MNRMKFKGENWTGEERRVPLLHMPSYLIRKSLVTSLEQAFSLGVQNGDVVIDIGCGEKPYYPIVTNKLKAYIGIDLVPSVPVDIVSVGERLPLCSTCADVIVSFQVLEHVKDPANVLREVGRVLRKGGTVILSVPCIYVYHPTPGDYWRWTPAGFKLFLEKEGFEVLKMWANGGLITAISVPILIQVARIAKKVERRRILRPLAIFPRFSIIVTNWIVNILERSFPQISDLETPNTMPANILVLARKPVDGFSTADIL